MNKILTTLICALMMTAAAWAQQASRSSTQPASSGKTGASSNEDLNIRAYIQLLRTDVRKQASEIVGQVMRLDADQSAKFWPIYKDFETENAKVGDQIIGLVKNYVEHYGEMTGDVTDRLVDQLVTIEHQRADLKKKYYERFKAALDPVTATRFVQVINQLEHLMDLQIAAQLPVVGEE
jgi:hypothetical protein